MNDDDKDNVGLRELATAAQGVPDDSFEANTDYREGERIADTEYTVRSRIGRGGHATVYECENNIGRVVAVKVIRRDLAKRPELLSAMLEEARRIVRLRHPKIVEVFRANVTEGARPIAFIEMERLYGGSGRQLLSAKKRVEVMHALDIMIDVCDALAAAHSKGVVHQDLKPDNIFMHFDEYTTQVMTKLLDFGVARIVGQAYQQSFEGTLPYAAPEQLSGGDVAPVADLYAVGVIMFEFLTGQRPFEAAEARDRHAQENHRSAIDAGRVDEASLWEHLVKAKVDQVAPRIAEIAEDVLVPRELEDIIAALLERDPAKRVLPPRPGELVEQGRSAQIVTASELAKRLRGIRALPGLKRGMLSTQELLQTTLRRAPGGEEAARKGSGTARFPPVPVLAVAAPAPAPSPEPRASSSPIAPAPILFTGAPASVQRETPPPHPGLQEAVTMPDGPLFGVTVADADLLGTQAEAAPELASSTPALPPHIEPVPVRRAAEEEPRRAAEARADGSLSAQTGWPTPQRKSDPLGSISSPAVRTNPLPAPRIVQRTTERMNVIDVGLSAPEAVIGTLEPVIERSGRLPRVAAPPASTPPRQLSRTAVWSLLAVSPFVLAFVLAGAWRLSHPRHSVAAAPSPALEQAAPEASVGAAGSATSPVAAPTTRESVAAVSDASEAGTDAAATARPASAPILPVPLHSASSAEDDRPAPKKPARRPTPKPAPSDSDDINTWLDKGPPKAKPGPGF